MYVRNLIASDRRSPINMPTTSLSGLAKHAADRALCFAVLQYEGSWPG